MAILTMPVIVLFLLRAVAYVADARTEQRSKRVQAAIDAIPVAAIPSGTSVPSLTEQAKHDQG